MTSQNAGSQDSHQSNERLGQAQGFQEAGYFSSSPLGSPRLSPFSINDEEISLGVYFSPDDGEANDILAALRASSRVVKETAEVVSGLRPKTGQVKDFAEILHSHEREFTTWICDSAVVLSTTRISIRSLPLFPKLAVYVNLLKDLQSDLPYRSLSTPPPTKGNFLRRLSSSASSRSRPSIQSQPSQASSGTIGPGENPRLTNSVFKTITAFTALKDAILLFGDEQRKLRESYEAMERTRKELAISHVLCLRDTRIGIRTFIHEWSESIGHTSLGPASSDSPEDQDQPTSTNNTSTHKQSKPVLVLTGLAGSGKSALAATLACEWKQSGFLGAHLFIPFPKPPSRRRSLGGKRSEDESDGDNVAHGSSLSRALSRLTYRRGSSGQSKFKGDISEFRQLLQRMAKTVEKREKIIIVVDGLDQAGRADTEKIIEAIDLFVKEVNSAKVLLTSRRKELPALSKMKAANLIDFVDLDTVVGVVDGETITKTDKRDDISRYVSSRLAMMLTPRDQDRVVDTVDGSFAAAVRVCRDVEESGAPERALDGILYREAVRRHGSENVKVLLV